mgnify:CR=1 FL=1
MITFGSDVADLILQRTLGENTLGLNNSINRMTTGYKVNQAKDNAAGYSIITDLSKKISSMLQVQQNTEDGIALLQTAEGGLEEVQKLLERLRDLATQASNGTYDAETREAMQAEADQARYKAMQDSISAAIKNATSAAELEALLAKYENQLLAWQLANLKKQNELLANTTSPVKTLYGNYTTALTELNELKFNLFEQELALAKANADLLDAQAYIAEQTAEQNEIIANAQAQIEIQQLRRTRQRGN